MPEGDPGQEQFARAITRFRNQGIMSAVAPLFTLRSEILFNDDFQMRTGIDNTTRDHILKHLVWADKIRRHVTYNPTNVNLEYIEQAIHAEATLSEIPRPFGGDEVQGMAGAEIDFPYALDGSDPKIPLMSAINFRSNHAKIVVGSLDGMIVYWTRLESRFKTWHITVMDSLRMYGLYNRFLSVLSTFSGDDALVDVAAGVLPDEEPLGPQSSPNLRTEGYVTGPNNSYTDAGAGGQQQAGAGGAGSAAQSAANQQQIPDFLR